MELVADRDALVAALRVRGVDWLAPSDARLDQPIDDEMLIGSLAAHHDPRMRCVLTALFILHSELARGVPEVMTRLDPSAQDELMARYMAAVYLQRLWRTRLSLYLGNYVELPDLYSNQLGLPDSMQGFGQVGLYALADWHQQRLPVLYNRLAEYDQQIESVVAALKTRTRQHGSTIAS